ncbi:hypothetical protein GGX14DRAFT_398928 [Mycena pura]|uniref:Uncharacterized protein n=1 Tax=Mycena pura TaxID=153505 RepID=A0AAD6V6D0_9AGAR|nr:hypothetical protein GGX14DRAFT_398928 [Mycena pura]
MVNFVSVIGIFVSGHKRAQAGSAITEMSKGVGRAAPRSGPRGERQLPAGRGLGQSGRAPIGVRGGKPRPPQPVNKPGQKSEREGGEKRRKGGKLRTAGPAASGSPRQGRGLGQTIPAVAAGAANQ